jgi:ubiquitin conjugation factor E4 B
MLMSDTTWYLEESLTNLAKIHSIRAQKANVEEWNAMEEAERTDTESLLKQAERSASFPSAMGRDHAELIRDITATTKEPFLTGEIVDRLAAVSEFYTSVY